MKFLPVAALTALLAACQSVQVEIPKVVQAPTIDIAMDEELAAVKLDTIGVKLKRGTIIGSYEPGNLGVSGCTFMDNNIFWNQGRVTSRDIEFRDIFFDTLNNANFNVVGDPNLMFASASDQKKTPEFLIGGQIEDIKLNICEEMHWWTGKSRGTQKGKGFVKVRWQAFSLFERKVVYETITEGIGETLEGAAGGEIIVLQEAFAGATDNLLGDKKFVDLLRNYKPTVADVQSIDKTMLEYSPAPLRDQPIMQNIDDIRLAVVSIDSGGGHGSGFFITPTLILTNNHVVQDAEFVRVNLLTGRRIIGEVLRSHPARDIALIQVEATGVRPLGIREEPLKVAEEVYAVGAPLKKGFSGSVTKGIVSKFLPNNRGLQDIQADVDVQGGNSGGPLLDSNGNLVGLTYAGIGPGKTSIGLNFFIPIQDGLQRLKMRPKKKTAAGS